MEPDTHEFSRRRSQLQVNPNALKPCRYSNETKTCAFDPWRNSYPLLHMNLGHDLTHPPYEDSGFHLSGVVTPIDFKYPDVRSREMTHLDRWLDFL
jgi:hypothetical protein